ncbi:MAG TPA: hypothetical protein VGC67_13790 [Cellulomonas sp.]
MNGWVQVAVVLCALLLSTLVGSWLTGWLLRVADRAGSHERPAGPVDGAAGADAADVGGGPDGPSARERLRGGTWIGVLERLAVTGTLLAGQPAGVAVVVAVKGLGRYPELRNGDSPGVSERFVIGTLASLVWSGALGLLGRWLLGR